MVDEDPARRRLAQPGFRHQGRAPTRSTSPMPPATALEGLRSFTITAWLNRTSDEEGPGGNRIVHMADTLGSRPGIDLVVAPTAN